MLSQAVKNNAILFFSSGRSCTDPASGKAVKTPQASVWERASQSIAQEVGVHLEPSGATKHAGGATDEGREVRPRLEPSGASEHAGGATDEGRAEPELSEDNASSRGSIDWCDLDAGENDAADDQDAEMADGADEVGDTSDSSNAGDRRRRSEPTDSPVVFDQLGAIAFALARTAALLPEFQTHARSRNALDAAWMKPMTGTCTEEDKDNLSS